MWWNYIALAFDLFAIAFFMVGSFSLHHESKRVTASYVYAGLAFMFSLLSVLQINRIIEWVVANAV